MLCARGHNALLAARGGGGGGVLSASGPGEGEGVPSEKEGRGGALYYMNGFLQLPPVSAHAFVSSH